MTTVGSETALALGYVAFLAAVAAVLEIIARHVHRRSERSSTAGFTFRHQFDAWECPDGRLLHREPTDTLLKVVRYRAPAHHCNGCVFKFRCTDSDDGRVIEHRLQSWIESGLYRFHRAMSVALLVLAEMILALELFRAHNRHSELVILAALVCVGATTVQVARRLRLAAQSDSSNRRTTPDMAA